MKTLHTGDTGILISAKGRNLHVYTCIYMYVCVYVCMYVCYDSAVFFIKNVVCRNHDHFSVLLKF